MPSMRSDPAPMTAHHAWALAILLAVVLILALQALAIRPPGTVLLGWMILLVASAHALRPASRWRGFASLKIHLITLVFGLLGLLLGIAWDLGAAGLLVLASWCSARGDFGLNDVLAKLSLAPWGHAGMLLGL